MHEILMLSSTCRDTAHLQPSSACAECGRGFAWWWTRLRVPLGMLDTALIPECNET